jgi:hypothetical protein
MSFSLTADAIANMFHGQQQGRPMLQVLHIKEVKKQDAMRYVVTLSDGNHFTPAMIVPGYNHLFRTRAIRQNCILEVKHYSVYDHLAGSDKHEILAILSLASVLYTKEEKRLGVQVKYDREEEDDESLYQPTDSDTDNSSMDPSMEEASEASSVNPWNSSEHTKQEMDVQAVTKEATQNDKATKK